MNTIYKDFPSNKNKMQTKSNKLAIGAIVGAIFLVSCLIFWIFYSPKMVYRNDAQEFNLYAQI